jgi:chromosome segregation protein
MHQIQKIELVGFKSFCDRTQMLFHEGVTAIVGPNGCGKSNIADAIGWVVGEQSAKSLRTDKMEGVIFAGTQARKATSMAEVVLTLSLMDHFNVPEGLDLNPDGFTVGRRLYRSGESEYLLDGKKCRLKDVQALFEGTGLGPNSYALIEQGRIGQILSSKPSDRRALIEEAARITLFRSRRYSAESKLESAQQNLLRVNDIIREIARQLDSLRRQAAKARRYARFREELRGLQKLKLAHEHRQLVARLEECTGRFNAAIEQEKLVLDELSGIEAERLSGQESYREQELVVEQMRDALANLKLESSNEQNLRQNFESQIQSLSLREKDLDIEQKSIEERRQVAQKELERIRQALSRIAEEILADQAVIDGENSRGEVLQKAIRQAEEQIDEVRSFLLNGAGRLAELKSMQARCIDNIQRIEVRMSRLEGESESKAKERAAFLAEAENLKGESAAISARQGVIGEQQAELEGHSTEIGASLDRALTDLAAQQEESSLLQHRFSSLEEIERRRSNYSEGVQKYLSTQLPGEESKHNETLADHLDTSDPRFESAIEDYLNDPLQYILVDRLDDAVSGVERLKRIGAGKCTFMTMKNGHPHAPSPKRPNLAGDGVVGYLDGLLNMRDDMRHAFERALPDFAATVMVEDLNTAFRVAETNPGCHFLTLSGESYSPRGTLSAVGERKSMAGFLAVKREKRELERKLTTLRSKMQATRDEVSRLKQEQALAAETLKTLVAESRKLEVDAVKNHHQLERVSAEISKIDQTEKVASIELAQLMKEKSGFEGKMQESSAGIAEIEQRSNTSNEELRELTARLDSLRNDSTSLTRSLSGLSSALAVKKERKSSLELENKRLLGEADDLRKRGLLNRAEKEGTLARLAELAQSVKSAEARIVQCGSRIRETETAFSEAQGILAGKRDALASLEERARLLHVRREEALSVRGKVEIEKTRLESDMEHLTRFGQEEFHLPVEQLIAEIDEAGWQRNLAEIQAQHDELKERIENFGAINMRALEEYQELDERYQFLTKQRTDIEQSIADTQKAIAEINKRSVEQFQDAFKHIRENFLEVFQLLFSGGQCDLRLLDDGDVLESGIDIIAQPPGKRLQNVLLLSGGEKALTALALLIAIFRYRPSPFCVLDEVDAPLDDANVTRFTQLIAELSKDTQFIVITHNKRTMEVARTLYGVTMEEPGVSKIVGVDFHKEDKKAG